MTVHDALERMVTRHRIASEDHATGIAAIVTEHANRETGEPIAPDPMHHHDDHGGDNDHNSR